MQVTIHTSPTVNATERRVMALAMSSFGGSFAQGLAEAMRRADQRNFERLIDAFPDMVKKYGPGTEFYRCAELGERYGETRPC